MSMKKILFGYQTALILLIVFMLAIAAATFIESGSGTESARNLVYNAKWFELLMALLTINMTGSLFYYKSFSWKKISVALFHLAFVLIMMGALLTRYTGEEGIVYIREGETTNVVHLEYDETTELPFTIALTDFVLERYPGSQSPSSYSSYVRVDDPDENVHFDFHIYMNHILKYRGWRFYQTSYDQDEKGTILTASHDVAGTALTYAGYILAVFLMLVSLFMPGTYFRLQLKKLKTVTVVLILMLMPALGFSKTPDPQKVVPKNEAASFGELVVQDAKGRMKPMNTLDNEFMRKLTGKEKIEGVAADQVVLSMIVFPDYWKNYPIIKVDDKAIRNLLDVDKGFVSFNELYNQDGSSRLEQAVDAAFMKAPVTRGNTDKNLIKLDEKANILHSFLTGKELNIFPVANAENNKWHSPVDASGYAVTTNDSLFLCHIFSLYITELSRSGNSGDYTLVHRYLNAMKNYQVNAGSNLMLSGTKINAELLYNKVNIFNRAGNLLGFAGIIMLVIFFVFVLKGKPFPRAVLVIFQILSMIVLLLVVAGLGLRWYIGGYVPVSNSYEVMVFLSFIVLLAGLLVSKNQPVVLALSQVLAFAFLLVALMNNGNPEIGNLVPVLKSYWLSIHVAVITASYAFFAIIMMIALVNMVLYLTASRKMFKRVIVKTEQLGRVNHVLMIIGIYLLTAGTILGAVWANESWGRYWGWDPKETWALISILIYSGVNHLRLIPGIKEEFWFNMTSFWAFLSILMTFFGVNYFLTGMHSYAGTGEASFPLWIIFVVIALIIFTLFSGLRYFRFKKKYLNWQQTIFSPE